jgi:hypothetical protein
VAAALWNELNSTAHGGTELVLPEGLRWLSTFHPFFPCRVLSLRCLQVVLGMPTISSGNSIGDPYVGVQAVIDSDGYKLIIGDTHQVRLILRDNCRCVCAPCCLVQAFKQA